MQGNDLPGRPTTCEVVHLAFSESLTGHAFAQVQSGTSYNSGNTAMADRREPQAYARLSMDDYARHLDRAANATIAAVQSSNMPIHERFDFFLAMHTMAEEA